MSDYFHEQLVETTPQLRAFARTLAGTADQADDLVQEAAVRALNARHLFTRGSNFRAWMFTILRNIHLNEQRRHHARNEPLEAASESRTSISATQDRRLELRDLITAMATLPAEQRQALLLVGADGLSHEEAAKKCCCAVGTIKSRVSRARATLTIRLSATRPEPTQKRRRR